MVISNRFGITFKLFSLKPIDSPYILCYNDWENTRYCVHGA
nr:MAG TPA: hypothetical protein [Caudoviricetes sp.]